MNGYVTSTNKASNSLSVKSLTSCFHEGFIEVEGEQRLWKVSKEVFEDACYHIDVFHFVKERQSLSSDELLLQVLNHTLLARDSVETNLQQNANRKKSICYYFKL